MEIVYTCDTCGMCNSVCPTYHPVDTILALREVLVKKGARRPSAIEKIDQNIEKTGNMFGAKTATPKKLIDVPRTGKDIYFAGCNALFLKTDVVNASLKTLKAAGLNISCLGNKEKCCGFVPGHDGNTALLEKRAAENVKMMKEVGAERIIVSCSHCLKAWKIDYPKIDDSYRFEVVHIAELYCKLIEKGKLEFKKALNKKVSFHDPCYLGRHSKVSFDVPRNVIKAIPGVELKEMQRNKKWSYCCGSGAKISSAVHPEMARATTKSRFEEAKKVADIIVTACTSCMVHMDKVIKKEDVDLKVYDLPGIVAEAMAL
jgi:heterodisulfide reductase subunit D